MKTIFYAILTHCYALVLCYIPTFSSSSILFVQIMQYVRPGATPIPGATLAGPRGVPSQVRASVSAGPIPGRGRGYWRPMQKSFYSGFGIAA